MEFRYQKRRTSLNPFAPLIPTPLVPVDLTYQGRTSRVWALLDSGADASIFDSSVAKLLGIELKEGLKQTFIGISGRVEAYFHEIELKLAGTTSGIKIAVAFAELQGVSGLLGQADFFKHHEITFERFNERMEINPVKKD